MSEHKAQIVWNSASPEFLQGRYSREHTWIFDGGLSIPASPSPHVVPVPFSNPDNVDPEEAFVAAVASCHMLTFLHLASRAGFAVELYEDEATGIMTRNENGRLWLSRIDLRPQVQFSSQEPASDALVALHHQAHEECFIANSVKSDIVVTPGPATT